MADEEDVPIRKLQPVMLVIEGRLECGKCGALAVILSMDVAEERAWDGSPNFDYNSYCQDCWHKVIVSQEAEEEA